MGRETTESSAVPPERPHQPLDRPEFQRRIAPVQLLHRGETVVLDGLHHVLVERPRLARHPKGAVLHMPPCAPRDLRQFLQDVLADDYRVTLAEHGEQALALACADPPDLIITDLMMPQMMRFTTMQRF